MHLFKANITVLLDDSLRQWVDDALISDGSSQTHHKHIIHSLNNPMEQISNIHDKLHNLPCYIYSIYSSKSTIPFCPPFLIHFGFSLHSSTLLYIIFIEMCSTPLSLNKCQLNENLQHVGLKGKSTPDSASEVLSQNKYASFSTNVSIHSHH